MKNKVTVASKHMEPEVEVGQLWKSNEDFYIIGSINNNLHAISLTDGHVWDELRGNRPDLIFVCSTAEIYIQPMGR